MRVINFNTANRLRRTDKAAQYILCKRNSKPAKLFHFPKPEQSDFRFESEFIYKTSPLGITPGGACVVPTHLARKPLRRIVARTLVSYADHWHTGHYFLDTLVCGHQIHTYRSEELKKRRGCQECLDALIIPLSEKVAA